MQPTYDTTVNIFSEQFAMSGYSSDTRLSRQRQITTLSVYNENVEEVADKAEYRVVCGERADQVQLSLLVQLPPEFPETAAPLILCSPPVLHPWISSGGRVTGAPGLNNFTSHSDLGMVVAAVRRELERSAPTLQPNASPVNVDYPQPPADFIRKKLSELEKDDLEDIINDEGAMDKFLDTISYPPLDNMVDNIASMEENIKAQAESNIELQNQIESVRDSLLNKVQEYHSKKAEMDQLHGELSALRARVGGAVLADRLVRLSVSNEEQSDTVAERFLARELGVEQFLQDYIKIRTDCHLQKLKADQVKKLP